MTGQASAHPRQENAEPQQPSQFARLAERVGEEDPEEMQHDRSDHDGRAPMMKLTHQQSSANLERQIQRRFQCPRHLDTSQPLIRPAVGDRCR